MNSTAKGNSLEDALVDYLTAQQERGDLVYGAHSPRHCKIRRKPKYPCPERNGKLEFDVVIEFFRDGATTPYLYVVFECKNYKRKIPEEKVRAFSDQLRTVFGHSAKGILVVSSRLQSGALAILTARSMGLVKIDEEGADVILQRHTYDFVGQSYLEAQLLDGALNHKALKFSAFYDGTFFSSPKGLLENFETPSEAYRSSVNAIPFLSQSDIRDFAIEILEGVHYKEGPVDLAAVCEAMSVTLDFAGEKLVDANGALVLGSVNLERNHIRIYPHDNEFRRRFTISHEIGHICLGHRTYLRSESVFEQDLIGDTEGSNASALMRLESQANMFASEILLPHKVFDIAVKFFCRKLEIRDKGFGLIFVDDQPCNYIPYNELIHKLSIYFQVSKIAIEFRLRKIGLLQDHRKFGEDSSARQVGQIFRI
ncbi:ImmA/IrrE family metallo-endopeptidase [Rhizobium sp. YIM 134829]|uniref:ImmA/IrrE family metallo-endopeptidase n=1 Tax=Rhizobium sp. YIM 134829 TaxID=3390453 RepID=UPI0039783485